MDQLVDMRAGHFISAASLSNLPHGGNKVPCFGDNGIRGYVDRKTHSGDYVLIGRQGALCGNVHRIEGDFYATEHAVVAKPRDGVNKDWLFHFLTKMNLNQYATKSAQPGLSVERISRLVVPLPSVGEQVKTARTLDSFDSLITNLSAGLPAELNARRQQYEYYRDRLLTFEEAA